MQVVPAFVPDNYTGKAVDLHESVTMPSMAIALARYNLCRQKLLSPFLWNGITGNGSANFTIVADGKDCVRELVEGDFLRIDIPGPGTVTGDGYDWVRVEKLKNDIVPVAAKSTGMILRPSANPENTDTATAHFFTDDATSTFILTLNDTAVDIFYYGRNESPNIKHNAVVDTVRNTLVAAGAMLGFSAIQWSALLKALLDK